MTDSSSCAQLDRAALASRRRDRARLKIAELCCHQPTRVGRAPGATKRHARLGRTARGPTGLVEFALGDDHRERLGQRPELLRARVVDRLIAAGRVRDVQIDARFQ